MNSSAGPSENRVVYLLARVNAGLATQWSQIAELAASLQQMLDDAHALGQSHVPSDRRSHWDETWRDLRATLSTLRSLDAEAQERFSAGNPSSDPLGPWSHIFEHEQEFRDQLAAIRTIGAESVPATERSKVTSRIVTP